jgi:hypothetical protein
MTELLPPILVAMKKKNYVVFTKGDYNLNIFGIRAKNPRAGKFDDLLGVCYKDGGAWVTKLWNVTTDPGTYYLADKDKWLNPKGVAILVPGQYRSAYKIGLHGKTKYEALVQSGGEVKVYRDTDLDTILDYKPHSAETGWFGINIHASSSTPYTGSDSDRAYGSVGAWSAGCQVFARDKDFREFMKLAKESKVRYGDSFTYTLLTEKQAYK